MASAPDDAPAAKMNDYLTCSICLETLKDSRTLACYHSFCMCCLAKFVKRQREKGKIIEEFNCPECETVFQLKPEQSVEEMPRNQFVNNMLEVLAIQRRPNEITCSFCDRKTPAVSRCTNCEKFLCCECLTAHGKWPGFKKHVVFTIGELTKPEYQLKIRDKARCKNHENETPQYYCETCKQLACIHCIVLEHNKSDGHSCVSTKKVAEQKRESLKSSSDFLNDQIIEGNDVLQGIDHITQKLKNNAKKAKDEISQHKQNILKAFTEKLEEKAKLLKNEIDKKYNEICEALLKQKADVKAYLGKVNGPLEFAKNLLGKGNDEEILSFQNEIEENVKNVKSKRPTMKPVHEGNIKYKANAVISIDITSNLDEMGEVVCLAAKDHRVLPLCENSTILNNHYDYCEQVVEWLGDQFRWRLCYRASTHGWSAQDFHKNCDDKGRTVTLIKVRDYIFGGYTDQNWKGQGWKQSNSSFLFSLKNKDKLPPFKATVYGNRQYAICSYPRCGSNFGGGRDLYICDNPHTDQGSFTNFGYTYQPPAGYVYNTEQAKSLLAGSYNFTTSEIEVFY